MKPDNCHDVTKPLASAPSVSSSELVRRLRGQALDLRIMEHLAPYADICERAATEIERMESMLESQIEETRVQAGMPPNESSSATGLSGKGQ